MIKDIWKILTYAYDYAWELIVINFLWFICALPALAGGFMLLNLPEFSVVVVLVLLVVFVLPLAAAQAGLYHSVRQLAYSEPTGWRVFLSGIRQHYTKSLRWTLLNTAVLGLLGFYILFLSLPDPAISNLVRGVSLGLLPWWLLIQVYTFPLLLEQETPSVLNSQRNSAILFLKWPVYSILLALFIYILIGISTWLIAPWAVFTASLCSYLAAFSVMVKLNRDPREMDEPKS